MSPRLGAKSAIWWVTPTQPSPIEGEDSYLRFVRRRRRAEGTQSGRWILFGTFHAMELDEFITSSLRSIMKGVSDAVKEHDVSNIGGFVNPRDARRADIYDNLTIQTVEFDVAVTVESGESTARKGGLIKVIEASVSAKSVDKRVGESRVRFSIPVALPGTRIES